MNDKQKTKTEKIEWLFLISSPIAAVSTARRRPAIVLENQSSHVIRFSDRPNRVARTVRRRLYTLHRILTSKDMRADPPNITFTGWHVGSKVEKHTVFAASPPILRNDRLILPMREVLGDLPELPSGRYEYVDLVVDGIWSDVGSTFTDDVDSLDRMLYDTGETIAKKLGVWTDVKKYFKIYDRVVYEECTDRGLSIQQADDAAQIKRDEIQQQLRNNIEKLVEDGEEFEDGDFTEAVKSAFFDSTGEGALDEFFEGALETAGEVVGEVAEEAAADLTAEIIEALVPELLALCLV